MEPVWPPPSAPWQMTASTPHSSTFCAWRLAAMVGMHLMPPALSRPMTSLFGAAAKLARATPCSMSRSTRFITSAWSARMLTPKGRFVRLFTAAMELSSSS